MTGRENAFARSRQALRMKQERQSRRSLVQLLCSVSLLRTGLTLLLPLAGGAAWWTLLLCVIPAMAVFLLAALAMRLTGTQTLTELARRRLGRGGVWLLCAVLGALLLLDAVGSLNALILLFTQGIGARGTQWTLALLTGGALLPCLHKEGLSRSVLLLRWLLLAGVVIALIAMGGRLRPDGLFPMQGSGWSGVKAALCAGAGMGWPLLMLLSIPAEKGRCRVADAGPALLGAMGVLLFACLIVPQERLAMINGAAACLLLPASGAVPAMRLLICCLMMLGLFLAVAAAVNLGAESLCVPLGGIRPWVMRSLLALVVGAQILPAEFIRNALNDLSPWLLLPPGVLLILCLFRARRLKE